MIIIDLFTLSCFTISKCYQRKNDQYEKNLDQQKDGGVKWFQEKLLKISGKTSFRISWESFVSLAEIIRTRVQVQSSKI